MYAAIKVRMAMRTFSLAVLALCWRSRSTSVAACAVAKALNG